MAQHPNANVLMASKSHQLVSLDGSPGDWWHESSGSYEFARLIYSVSQKGPGTLVSGLAIDEELAERVWNRASGRWVFFITRDRVILVGLKNSSWHINLASRLKAVHKPMFSLGFNWPSEAEVEAALD